MVLLGLAGRERSIEHARATARALNLMQPRLLSALRVVPVPGTPLAARVKDGSFDMLSEADVVRELCEIISSLEVKGTIFRANHNSNVVPLEGRLPQDKARVIAQMESLLASGALDESGPGDLPLWL